MLKMMYPCVVLVLMAAPTLGVQRFQNAVDLEAQYYAAQYGDAYENQNKTSHTRPYEIGVRAVEDVSSDSIPQDAEILALDLKPCNKLPGMDDKQSDVGSGVSEMEEELKVQSDDEKSIGPNPLVPMSADDSSADESDDSERLNLTKEDMKVLENVVCGEIKLPGKMTLLQVELRRNLDKFREYKPKPAKNCLDSTFWECCEIDDMKECWKKCCIEMSKCLRKKCVKLCDFLRCCKKKSHRVSAGDSSSSNYSNSEEKEIRRALREKKERETKELAKQEISEKKVAETPKQDSETSEEDSETSEKDGGHTI